LAIEKDGPIEAWIIDDTSFPKQPVVKNCLALICSIPIRSLRTKWSRTKNKSVMRTELGDANYISAIRCARGITSHHKRSI